MVVVAVVVVTMAVDGWDEHDGGSAELLRVSTVCKVLCMYWGWMGRGLSIGFNWGSGWGRAGRVAKSDGPTFGPHRDYNFAAGAKFLELFFSFLLQIKKYDTKLPRPPLVSHGARLPDLK